MRHALRVLGVGEVCTYAQTDSVLINEQKAVLIAGSEYGVFTGMQVLLGVGDDIARGGEGQCADQDTVARPLSGTPTVVVNCNFTASATSGARRASSASKASSRASSGS